MVFTYENKDGSYKYDFIFNIKWKSYIDIISYKKGCLGRIDSSGWMHLIKDGKIIWRNDDSLNLSPEAKEYISDIVSRRAYWFTSFSF